jgi:hypothetical protein
LINIKLAEKPLDSVHNALFQNAEDGGNYSRQYSRGSLSLLLGTGIQYRLNQSQALIMGVSYQRGLNGRGPGARSGFEKPRRFTGSGVEILAVPAFGQQPPRCPE